MAPPAFARPDSDIAVGNWSQPPLWSKVDEVNADDTDRIIDATASPSTCELGLSNVPDPLDETSGHIIRTRARLSGLTANTELVITLKQGATTIATFVRSLTTTFATVSHTLTAAQAGLINNYDDLSIQLRGSGGVQEVDLVWVSWVEFEVPAPPARAHARPDGDNLVGTWFEPPLWSKVDEGSADDTDRIIDATASPSTCELGLSDVADPQSSTNHVVWIRARRFGPTANTELVITLKQGSATIASFGQFLTISWATFGHTLTAAQADSITNYNDLRIQLTGSGGVQEADLAFVSWVDFTVPLP